MMKTRLTLPFFLILNLIVSACTSTGVPSASDTPQPALVYSTLSVLTTRLLSNANSKPPIISNGDNRYLSNSSDLHNAKVVDIPLDGNPTWVAGIPYESGSIWAVALEDGRLQAFLLVDNDYTTIEISPEQLRTGMPLTIFFQNENLFALTDLAQTHHHCLFPFR